MCKHCTPCFISLDVKQIHKSWHNLSEEAPINGTHVTHDMIIDSNGFTLCMNESRIGDYSKGKCIIVWGQNRINFILLHFFHIDVYELVGIFSLLKIRYSASCLLRLFNK